MKRVFNIDVETCSECGGAVKVIPKALATLAGQALACIEDLVVIQKILDYLKEKAETGESNSLPESRAPPVDMQASLFD